MRPQGPGPLGPSLKNAFQSRLVTWSLAGMMAVCAAAAGSSAAYALQGSAYLVEVLVGGVPLHEYQTSDAAYVEALKGREYAVRLTNHTPERVAVALSVDGLNSIDAKTTTAQDATKWILGPYESITLDGWQTSSRSARRFFFTSEKRSYGAWLGQTRNLGLIAAAFFRERRPAPIARVLPFELPARPGGRDDNAPYGRSREGRPESGRPAEAPSVQGGTESGRGSGGGDSADDVQAGTVEGATGSRSERETSKDRAARAPETRGDVERKKALSSTLAATGIGRELDHPVERVAFDEEPLPAALLEIRYEYRDALVHLGVIPPPWQPPCGDDPYARRARARARGFEEPDYAPDPYRQGGR